MMLKDVAEAVECTKEFAHTAHNDLICKLLIIDKLLEAKASAVDGQLDLLAQLFGALRTHATPVITADELQAGLLRACNAVADASLDAPSCPTLVAKLFAQLVATGCVQLGMLQTILVEQVLLARPPSPYIPSLCESIFVPQPDSNPRLLSVSAPPPPPFAALAGLGGIWHSIEDGHHCTHCVAGDRGELSLSVRGVFCCFLMPRILHATVQSVGEDGLKQMLGATPLDFGKFNPAPPVSSFSVCLPLSPSRSLFLARSRSLLGTRVLP